MALASENWTESELDAAVKAYMEMLSKEKSGIAYKKSDYRNELLSGPLKGRTPGSFEFRMQNISHVLSSLGQQYIAGYKPARNVGPKPFASIVKSLERNKLLDLQDLEPTPDPKRLMQRAKRIQERIDLQKKPIGQAAPKKAEISATAYYLDPAVLAWIIKNAKGKCEACEMDAPFFLPGNQPFLEVHYMQPLEEGGPDTIENAVALCPNCHRRSHLSVDKAAFKRSIYSKVKRLSKEPEKGSGKPG